MKKKKKTPETSLAEINEKHPLEPPPAEREDRLVTEEELDKVPDEEEVEEAPEYEEPIPGEGP